MKKPKKEKHNHDHGEHSHEHEEMIPIARVMQSVFCLIQQNDDLVITDTIFYITEVIIDQIERETGDQARDVFTTNFVNDNILNILHMSLDCGNEMIVL